MKYRKKPVTIEAIQWTGKNKEEIEAFVANDKNVDVYNNSIIIHTLEGNMFASVGDYIIRGIYGEYYPCKPDIFMDTYDPVKE